MSPGDRLIRDARYVFLAALPFYALAIAEGWLVGATWYGRALLHLGNAGFLIGGVMILVGVARNRRASGVGGTVRT